MTGKKFDPSRRNLCRQGLVLAGGVVVAGLLLKDEAAAQSGKASQAAAMHQDHPRGQDQCDRGTHYIPGKTASANGTCQVVDGSISPKVRHVRAEGVTAARSGSAGISPDDAVGWHHE